MASLRRKVPSECAGERLDSFLASLDEIGSRALAVRLLESGEVTVDGLRSRKSQRLQGAEIVEVVLPRTPERLIREDRPLTLAYEDEHLLVVDKPAGISVHPGAGRRGGTLANVLVGLGARGGEEPERPGIVHRLDKDTSGLLVVARSEAAFLGLRRMVRRHEIEREYLALVRGKARSRRGAIEAAIGRDRRRPTRRSLDTATPREAITHFRVLEFLPEHTLLSVELETGRTHQIRVHLAAVDLPISGDPVYGVGRDLDLERQFLHACRLSFEHPVTGAELDLRSPLPDDLERALERARARGR